MCFYTLFILEKNVKKLKYLTFGKRYILFFSTIKVLPL